MPIIKSAKKRLRQNQKRRTANSNKKAKLRTSIKKVKELAKAGEKEKAREEFRTASSLLDKALKTNLFHKNTVNRHKTRLSKLLK